MGVKDRRARIRRRAWGAFLLVAAGLAALWAAADAAHLRWDLTADKAYTLSEATRRVLAGLDEPVKATAYITRDLPQPYGRLRRFVADLLAAYHDAAGDRFQYEVLDPSRPEVQARVAALGIPRVQVQVVEHDRAQIREGYAAIVLEYLDRHEIIPIVQSETGLEYLITRKIRKLVGKGRKKIVFVTGFGADDISHFAKLEQLAGDDYEFETVDPYTQPIPGDAAVAIVPGVARPPARLWRFRLQQFWLRGGGLLVLADNAKPVPGYRVVPVDPYANRWLAEDYHVVVGEGLVMDREAGRIVVEEQNGPYVVRALVDYPFLVMASRLDAHPVTANLGALSLLYPAPLSWEGGPTMKRRVLVRSSPGAAVQSPPYSVDPAVPLSERLAGRHTRSFALALLGEERGVASFEAPPAGATDAERKGFVREGGPARLVVVGTSTVFWNELLRDANLIFALNALDWLAHDEDLIALRGRGVHVRLLPALSEGEKRFWKGLWIAGLPLVALGWGLVRWRRLRRREREGAGA